MQPPSQWIDSFTAMTREGYSRPMIAKPNRPKCTTDRFLEGQLLLAMPAMTDKRFRRSVIYMCRHSEEGAMGIIINKRAKKVTFASLLKQLDLLEMDLDDEASLDLSSRTVRDGGPVSTERGFVLHSSDFTIDEQTLPIADGICLTATIEILKAIARGAGPADCLLALGYAGWAPSQLEGELQANGWLHCPADRELVFDDDLDGIYDRALMRLGIDPAFLVGNAGHA
jgi:putative transcriptional regulator